MVLMCTKIHENSFENRDEQKKKQVQLFLLFFPFKYLVVVSKMETTTKYNTIKKTNAAKDNMPMIIEAGYRIGCLDIS